VLYRQTSSGTFGGGFACICLPCRYIFAISCCNSGDNDTPGGNDGTGVPSGSTIDGGCDDNGTPGGHGGGHGSPGANTTPGGGPGSGGGAGTSLSTRRTDPDATVISPLPCDAAPQSASIAMAAAPATSTAFGALIH
jgi:hypothetical protein